MWGVFYTQIGHKVLTGYYKFNDFNMSGVVMEGSIPATSTKFFYRDEEFPVR